MTVKIPARPFLRRGHFLTICQAMLMLGPGGVAVQAFAVADQQVLRVEARQTARRREPEQEVHP